ncbi:MAG: GGDEF domain-containing protein [Gaiellaceae bacterium]
MVPVELGVSRPLHELTAGLREEAWDLAQQVVDQGLATGAVPTLATVDELTRLANMPAFVAELAREISDPQPSRTAAASPLLALAREHARAREQLGFPPREVLEEFLLLRRVLRQALVRYRDVLDLADPNPVEDRLDVAFDRLVVECAVAYFDRAMEELAERARRDALTGLLNHQAFWKSVATELERAARYGRGFTLVYVDVDRFKHINDTYGHPTGDQVLRAIADLLRTSLRESDLIGRTGGDEFAACLVETDPGAGAVFAERLNELVGAMASEPNFPSELSLSAGYAHFPFDAASAEVLFEQADRRLYESKRSKNS